MRTVNKKYINLRVDDQRIVTTKLHDTMIPKNKLLN